MTLGRHRAVVLGATSFVVLAVLWQAVVQLGLVNPFFVSSPLAVGGELVAEWNDGSLADNLESTGSSFAVALVLASVAGIALGALAGWFRDVESALDPFIWFKYSAPTVAFTPLFVAWLGYGAPTIIAIGFLFALTPIYANTLAGIRDIDRDLATMARAFGAGRGDLFLRVALPGSIPVIVAGLRLGVGRTLTGVIVAELFAANTGLGFSIGYYAQLLQTTKMMASIVVTILLGVLLTQALSFLEARTQGWRVTDET